MIRRRFRPHWRAELLATTAMQATAPYLCLTDEEVVAASGTPRKPSEEA